MEPHTHTPLLAAVGRSLVERSAYQALLLHIVPNLGKKIQENQTTINNIAQGKNKQTLLEEHDQAANRSGSHFYKHHVATRLSRNIHLALSQAAQPHEATLVVHTNHGLKPFKQNIKRPSLLG